MSALHLGACYCNQIELSVKLPKALERYSPSACDCEFCTDRKIMYLADPEGQIDIVSTISLTHIIQGSKQAEFLKCVNCEQVVAVISTINGERKGAVNAECLHDSQKLAVPIPTSSDQLRASEKKARWASTWSLVSLSEPD